MQTTFVKRLGLILGAGATISGLALGCASEDTTAPAPISFQTPAAQATQATTDHQVSHTGRVIEVELGDLYIKPAGSLDIARGEKVTFKVTNKGAAWHDFRLSDKVTTPMLKSGETAEVEVTADSNMLFFCSVTGHKEAGMKMDVKVAGASAVAGQAAPATAKADTAATIDPNAKPDADWKPFDPALKPAEGGKEHKITLEATETQVEVAPGVMQEMWTFNDQVPGPVLRGKVGDIFTITLVNKGKMAHSIDLHASKVAWNDEMRSINPGESLVYQFEAKFSGIWMYHCGTAPALHHIGNGMHGTIIIDPPDLAPVAHEFVFVQSELYLGPQGQAGDLQKMLDDNWDAVVFNNYFNQYMHAPIRVEPGERVRVWVVDNGPSENSSFHIVGTVFDTVYKEGAYLLRPDGSHGGSQALDLQPAQGGFVEFTFDEAGLYPFVTHKFSNASQGALGLFQAGEVAAGAVGGH